MNDTSCCVSKTESIDAMRKIVSRFIEQCTNMHMSLWKMKAFSSSYVEISGDFIQRQGTLIDYRNFE